MGYCINTENQEKIECIDEIIGDCHILYLVNGDSKWKCVGLVDGN